MKLSFQGLNNPAYAQKGYLIPSFDIPAMRERTLAAPAWLHFGAGNLFRAFPAAALNRLLERGIAEQGVIVVEGFDRELIEKAYRPFDDLSLLVTLKADGTIEKQVIASVAAAWQADPHGPDGPALTAAFESPALQMVSFTITEKGYAIGAPVLADQQRPPEEATSMMGRVCALLLRRFLSGGAPLALVSMDNCSHNGDQLKAAVLSLAKAWIKRGFAPEGLVSYLSDPGRVSFPLSMIDKITPRPDLQVQQMLQADGFEDAGLIQTTQGTFTAAFVNAEETEYLVIEDRFPAGRPPLEQAGILFTDRKTVDLTEKMKVCTCLNPLHTALAIFGYLRGFSTIAEEMQDADLRALVTRLGYDEGLPVVADPGIIRPEVFLRQVLEVRLPNPFMPDTPQRIATDTSQKISIRFGETLKAYQASDILEVTSLRVIPLVLAGWLRYLMGLDDEGRPFERSPDPMLETLSPIIATLRLGEKVDEAALAPLLSDPSLFGVDLAQVGLAPTVLMRLSQMCEGPGAVRRTIQETLAQAR